MKKKFDFLCGKIANDEFILAVKFDKHPWHYFEERDSKISEHGHLPAELNDEIGTLTQNQSIPVKLNEEQARNYFRNGKFVFKEKELKTYMTLENIRPKNETPKRKVPRKDTSRLVFISGQSNPLLFLKEFEKCQDVATDKDKMFKIRNFVDDNHLAEFNEFYLTSNWQSVKLAFLKKYSLLFIENKKKNLSIKFEEEESLRVFVDKMLTGLGTYTTLPFINRMEIILNDLPASISQHFLLHDKLDCPKAELLDFCDCIQSVIEDSCGLSDTEEAAKIEKDTIAGGSGDGSQSANRMEIFNFVDRPETDESMSVDTENDSEPIDDLGVPSTSKRGRGLGRGRGRGEVSRGRGRGIVLKNAKTTTKVLAPIPEDDSSSCSYSSRLRRSTRSSRSSVSSTE